MSEDRSDMSETSTNRTVRQQQFRATARKILTDARSPWGTADPVGQLARAMERTYMAGAANVGEPEEALDAGGHVRWDAREPVEVTTLDALITAMAAPDTHEINLAELHRFSVWQRGEGARS